MSLGCYHKNIGFSKVSLEVFVNIVCDLVNLVVYIFLKPIYVTYNLFMDEIIHLLYLYLPSAMDILGSVAVGEFFFVQFKK